MDWKHFYIGDSCLCWQLGGTIDKELSARVLSLYRGLKSLAETGEFALLDVVPAYQCVAVHFNPVNLDTADLMDRVHRLILELPKEAAAPGGKQHILPVAYSGPDLDRVARHCGLSVSEVIHRHESGTYQVAMIGFKPHFPYLIGLDPTLETPRLETPRTLVPAGAVAIGGAQTGVYPCDSPGGWNIIGKTDPARLITIAPGDVIRFESITRSEEIHDSGKL